MIPSNDTTNSGKELIKTYLDDMPVEAGVYRMLDVNKKVIYIGKAKNLLNRVKQYTGSLSGKTALMISLTHYLEYSVTESESSALLLEAQLIRKFKPKFNILLKDDRSFPYIKLRMDHAFPQVVKYRGKDFTSGKFFGPFASVGQVEVTLKELQKIFKLRSCSDSYFAARKRPCLQYQIGRCSAPCVGKITESDYAKSVRQVMSFLSGKNLDLQGALAKEMQDLSDKLQFEQAAVLRDRIRALSYIQLKAQGTGFLKDTDLIAVAESNGEYCIQLYIYRSGQFCGNQPYFLEHTEEQEVPQIVEAFIMQLYQDNIPPQNIVVSHPVHEPHNLMQALYKLHGIRVKITQVVKEERVVRLAVENARSLLEQRLKKSVQNLQALEEVQKLFDLPAIPDRIEVYDNSHIQGSFAIGAMIVAGSGGFDKKEYRLFTIRDLAKNSVGGDDYAMLKEVLTRRLMRLESCNKPDLMVIDGGKGHMGVVEQVMQKLKLNIPFVCMAKGIDRNSGKEWFYRPDHEPFTLDKHLPVMKYLQILRDEVHNFAIRHHRKKRSKAITVSALDDIPNIGKVRKRALLGYFGSFSAIKDAGAQELTKVPGISKEIATIIYNSLRDK